MSCNNASSSLKTKPQGKNNINNNKSKKQKQRSSYQVDFYTYYKDSTNQKKVLKITTKLSLRFQMSHYWECFPPKQLKMLWENPKSHNNLIVFFYFSSSSSSFFFLVHGLQRSTTYKPCAKSIKQCNARWKGKKQISSLLQKKRKNQNQMET